MATCIHSFESCLIITWKISARLLHIMENCCRNHRNTVPVLDKEKPKDNNGVSSKVYATNHFEDSKVVLLSVSVVLTSY